MFYDDDADLSLLEGKTIAVLGYGSQGHAHALNHRDSGQQVVVGLREDSSSVAKAREDGLDVLPIADAASRGDVVMVLLPDEKHGEVYREEIRDGIAPGNLLMFGHGFSIHYGEVEPGPEVDVAMIAPKSPGHLLRREYLQGEGVPGLVAVHQDATGKALHRALAYGAAIGCAKPGIIETTFKEETETDLFGEQTVLCGGISELIRNGFETLVDAGYQPEIAYFECLHELKLIIDLIYEGGLSWMRYSVSDTAEWGDYVSGPRVVDAHVREQMRTLLGEIQDGTFATRWIDEADAGFPEFLRLRRKARSSQLEQVGRELRQMMPWLESERKVAPG